MGKEHKYLVFDIINTEPIKIGATGVRSQVESSETYIPGSTVRGATISKLILTKNVNNNLMSIDNKIDKKEILTNLYFYNAYPYISDKDNNIDRHRLCIKHPISLRTDKHKYREERIKGNNTFEGFINILDDKKKNPNMINNIPLEYIRLDNNKITNYIVDKEIRLHHNKTKSNGLKDARGNNEINNIFRYEAIKRNNQFCGIIKGDEKLLNIIEKSISKDNIMYIGGSKGSGYGKCYIKNYKIIDSYIKVKKYLTIDYKFDSKNRLQLNCISDCILRDEEGNTINYILPEKINKIVGNDLVDIKKEARVIADVSYSQGYNMKWGMRYPKEACLKAGSVIEYECTRKITYNDIINIEKTLYGARKTDGYGWVMANVKIPYIMDLKDNNIQENVHVNENRVNQEELITRLKGNKTFNIIIENLNHSRDMWIEMLVRKEKDNIKCFMSNSLKEDIKRNILDIDKDNIANKLSGNQIKIIRDKDRYSIYGESLYKLLINADNKDRSKFICDKMNTTKGKLLYKGNEEKFIKDFILKTFEVYGGADSE